MEENRKNLEIVAGNGSNLNISPVYEHINTSRPKSSDKRPTNIIVPSSIKEENSSNDNIEKQHEEDSNIETIDDVTFDIIEEETIETSDNDDDKNIEDEDEDLFFVDDDEDEDEEDDEIEIEDESIVKAKDKDKELYIKDTKNNVEFNSIFFDEELLTINEENDDKDEDEDQNKIDDDND